MQIQKEVLISVDEGL